MVLLRSEGKGNGRIDVSINIGSCVKTMSGTSQLEKRLHNIFFVPLGVVLYGI